MTKIVYRWRATGRFYKKGRGWEPEYVEDMERATVFQKPSINVWCHMVPRGLSHQWSRLPWPQHKAEIKAFVERFYEAVEVKLVEVKRGK